MMYSTPATPLSERDFHDRIYRGEILRFDAIPAMLELAQFAQKFLAQAFHPHPPPQIHQHLSHEEQIPRFAQLQKQFWKQNEVSHLWQDIFRTIGLDPQGLTRDHLHLRFQPHQDKNTEYSRARTTSTLAFHRDTWGSNLYAQVNWWAPIFPISQGRTVAMYPALWNRAVANTSAQYDLAKILERSRAQGRNAVSADEAIPHLTETLDPELAIPVVIEPGSLIAFSGAHAHAGVPNATGLTRLSLETRTLSVDDFRQNRGAPNMDGHAPWAAPGWFRHMVTGEKLSDLLGLEHIIPYPFPTRP